MAIRLRDAGSERAEFSPARSFDEQSRRPPTWSQRPLAPALRHRRWPSNRLPIHQPTPHRWPTRSHAGTPSIARRSEPTRLRRPGTLRGASAVRTTDAPLHPGVVELAVSAGLVGAVGLAGRIDPDAWASPRRTVVRHIDHDDYDPIGTVVLIALYFALITLLWLFTYFVEFLGGGPTIGG
nr:signal peptidase complex subunit 2 [Halorientalis brevis]